MYAIRGYDAKGRAIVGIYGLHKRRELYTARAAVQAYPCVVSFRMLFLNGRRWSFQPV